jgi:hypothetical protein
MGFFKSFVSGLSQGIGKVASVANHIRDVKNTIINKGKDFVGALPGGHLLNQGIETLMNSTPVGSVLRKANEVFDRSVDVANNVAGKMRQIEEKYGVSPVHQAMSLATKKPEEEPTGTDRRMNALSS